jgi:hypothetical protein
MKTVKLTKKMLKMHPADLLIRLGAVNLEAKLAFPQHVYMAKEDYKKLTENLKTYAKKMNPNSIKRIIDYSVGADMLNYGPNQTLEDAIRPGYVLIDAEGINSNTTNDRLD